MSRVVETWMVVGGEWLKKKKKKTQAHLPCLPLKTSDAKGTLALLCCLTASAAYKQPPLRSDKKRADTKVRVVHTADV